MAVLVDREDELAVAARALVLVGVGALVHVPAVVLEARRVARREVDLLPLALADVGDVEVAVGPVERVPPGVPQAVSDDLPVRALLVHVDAQELAEPRREVLRPVLRVARAAAVSHPDVELAVRPELELAALVIRVRLVDQEELPHPKRRAPVGAGPVLGHDGVAVEVHVVDEEPPVLLVIGMERDREQPALAAELHQAADVQERLGLDAPVRDQLDATDLLDHVETSPLAGGVRDVHGSGEALGDPDETQVQPSAGRGLRSPRLARKGAAAFASPERWGSGQAPATDATSSNERTPTQRNFTIISLSVSKSLSSRYRQRFFAL